jgi:hypothetical protein
MIWHTIWWLKALLSTATLFTGVVFSGKPIYTLTSPLTEHLAASGIARRTMEGLVG